MAELTNETTELLAQAIRGHPVRAQINCGNIFEPAFSNKTLTTWMPGVGWRNACPALQKENIAWNGPDWLQPILTG